MVVNLLEDFVARVQLALNVSRLDEAIAFYSKLFDAEPAKVRPGYANFAIEDPPLKLVLIEGEAAMAEGVTGALNHLGVEVGSPTEVTEATARLSGQGLDTRVEEETTCCYALQDKVWVSDPDGAPWEVYTVLADVPVRSDSGGRRRVLRVGIGRRRGHPRAISGSKPALLLIGRPSRSGSRKCPSYLFRGSCWPRRSEVPSSRLSSSVPASRRNAFRRATSASSSWRTRRQLRRACSPSS